MKQRVNEEFGKAVRQKLEEKGWSFRRATIASGVTYGTIGNMAAGMVPGRDHIIDWAVALGEDVNYWLKLAGYEPIPCNLVSKEGKSPVPNSSRAPIIIPDEVKNSIANADSRERKIDIAFKYVRSVYPRLGSSGMAKMPTEAKLSLVRMFEDMKDVKILPDEVI